MDSKIAITTIQGARYFESLKAKYTADFLEAQSHLETYFNHAVGIGEHSDIQVELDKWITKLTDSKDKLETLNTEFILSQPKLLS